MKLPKNLTEKELINVIAEMSNHLKKSALKDDEYGSRSVPAARVYEWVYNHKDLER